jgi:hypothetical protein
MQFKLDENLPPAAAGLLRVLGLDVMSGYDQGLQSCAARHDPERMVFWRRMMFCRLWLFLVRRSAAPLTGPAGILSPHAGRAEMNASASLQISAVELNRRTSSGI